MKIVRKVVVTFSDAMSIIKDERRKDLDNSKRTDRWFINVWPYANGSTRYVFQRQEEC